MNIVKSLFAAGLLALAPTVAVSHQALAQDAARRPRRLPNRLLLLLKPPMPPPRPQKKRSPLLSA